MIKPALINGLAFNLIINLFDLAELLIVKKLAPTPGHRIPCWIKAPAPRGLTADPLTFSLCKFGLR